MIKIGDTFEIERDKYQWILTEWVNGYNKQLDKPTRTARKTYHANTEQIARELLERQAGCADSLEELIDTYNTCTQEICSFLNNS